MFEREIKFIYDFNLNKVNRLGPYFTFEQLLSSDIHPAILQYISAEIDYLIYEDRQKLLKNSLFDYSGEKISFLFNQISEEAKRSKRFAQEYIAKLILHASSFTINYLVRPKWTLTKFVFEEDNHKSTNDIKQILNYVHYYKYVNKILVSYINSKKILSMNAQEFEDLLNKADKLGVETYLPSILGNAMKSMAEFFNIGEIQKLKIPLAAVEMFLEEKELFKHLQKVNEVFGNEEGARFNLPDYLKVFNNIIMEKEVLVPEPESQEQYETVETAEEEKVVEEKHSPRDIIIGETGETEETTEEMTNDEEEEEEEQDELASDSSEQYQDDLLEGEDDFQDELEAGNEISVESDELDEEKFDDVIPETDTGEEIIITPPLKLRIKINEDSRIEPVTNEIEEERFNPPEEEDESELDGDEIVEEDEVSKHLPEESNETEKVEDETKKEFAREELHFQDELDLAQSEFEEINDDDKSFLQSLRDRKESEEVERSESDSSDLPDESGEDRTFPRKKSEWPVYSKETGAGGSPINNYEGKEQKPTMDLAELLEHKDMTKIIETIFDYDFEDFANTLDEISNCKNEDDAQIVINETLVNRHISRTSKEAESFRSIISEYFNNK